MLISAQCRNRETYMIQALESVARKKMLVAVEFAVEKSHYSVRKNKMTPCFSIVWFLLDFAFQRIARIRTRSDASIATLIAPRKAGSLCS